MSKIIGNTTTTPVPRSDWEQTDKAKADFIRHKPELGTIASKNIDDFYAKVEIDEKLDEIRDAKADWSQNDSTALGYIKNRTHWTDRKREAVLETTSSQVTQGDIYVDYESEESEESQLESQLDFQLISDELYIITIDGVEYETTAYSWTDEYGETFTFIGDSRLLYNEFGYYDSIKDLHPQDVPFIIWNSLYVVLEEVMGARYQNEIYINNVPEGTLVKIEKLSDDVEYHTLDENFIPDTIARKAYVDEACSIIKNDLLNGAGDAYDTLKELGDLIDDNHDAIDALEVIADSKADAKHSHNYYGVCKTAAGTAAKTVEIEGFELVTGAMVIVKFDNSNSASNPTLNVSGTGAKPMYRYGTTALSTGTTTTGWYADSVQMFVYDGTGWIRDYWNNSTYSNAGLGSGYATCSTAADTLAKTATLSNYTLATGGVVSVKFNNAVPANATLNIASKGAKNIYYKGAVITDGVIKAGDTATFVYSTQYHLIAIDRWQEDIEEIRTLIGDAPVSEQINNAIATIPQTDWSQNDETALDYVKNRTHWVEQTIEVMLEEQVITGDFADLSDQMQNWQINSGERFIVTVDGISYKCISWDTVGEPYIGDSRLQETYEYDEETGEDRYVTDNSHPEDVPFLISHYVESDGDDWFGGGAETVYWSITFSSDGSHTLKIERENPDQTTYHTLDEKYIPDTIARKEEVQELVDGEVSDRLSSKMDKLHPSGEGSFRMNHVGLVGQYSSSLGSGVAYGDYAHAEGWATQANGIASHAEGMNTQANGEYSHAEGYNTHADSSYQHVQGKYNIIDESSIYAHIIGNGDGIETNRSNAHTIDWSGNAWFSGDVYIGSTSGKNRDEGSKKLATEEFVNNAVVNLNPITNETIDAICGGAIAYAEDVMF